MFKCSTSMSSLQVFVAAATAVATVGAQSLSLGPSAFTAPGVFPTSLYSKYYNNPTQTASQVQPIISDPVTVCNTNDTSYEGIRMLMLTICSMKCTR